MHPAVLPRLDPLAGAESSVADLMAELRRRGFSGDLATDYATRLTAATDNSIYQVLPAAVIFPRTTADVALALRLIDEPRFHGVSLTARGGGTGTNGQALTSGVVLDLSRHMAKILEVDVEAGFVRVQPGVVLDDLNDSLKSRGVYFAANLSPSNRATLGGMIATDASGEGSRRHGKTSHHVLELEDRASRRSRASHRTRRRRRARRALRRARPGRPGARARARDRDEAGVRHREHLPQAAAPHDRLQPGPHGGPRRLVGRSRAARDRQRGLARRGHGGPPPPDALREPSCALRAQVSELRRGARRRRVADCDGSRIGGDPRRDGSDARAGRRHLRPGTRLSRRRGRGHDRRDQPRRVHRPRRGGRTHQGRRAARRDRAPAGRAGHSARIRADLESRPAREPVEPAQEGRGPPRQRPGAAQAGALRGRHGGPARAPAGVRARVSRAARRRGAALRHVRPRGRRLLARAAGARLEGSRGRSARAAHHRRGRCARHPLRWPALGGARQGLSLGARAAPLRPRALP